MSSAKAKTVCAPPVASDGKGLLKPVPESQDDV